MNFINPDNIELHNNENRIEKITKEKLKELYPQVIYWPGIVAIENPKDEEEIIRLVLVIEREIRNSLLLQSQNDDNGHLADGAQTGSLLQEEIRGKELNLEEVIKGAEAIIAASTFKTIYISDYPHGLGKE